MSILTHVDSDSVPKVSSAPSSPPPKLLDQVREVIRYKHYSLRTERVYVGWIRQFILFHNKRHPKEMRAFEVEQFLSHLANVRDVAVSTHNQALSALLFLYKEVLTIDLPWLGNIGRPQKPKRVPTVLTVLTVAEVQKIITR